MPSITLIVAVGLVVVGLVLVITIMNMYQAASPNNALVVWGRGGLRCFVGGGTVVWPVIQKYERMYTGLRSLPVEVAHVYTQDGVPINVKTVVQFKIGHELDKLRNAAYRFLGKKTEEIDSAMVKTFDGHLRTIIATLTAIQVLQDQASFAEKVVNLSATDLNPLGLTIDSFVIKEISDDQGYYDSLGAKEIAKVKQEAAVAQAEAERTIREQRASASLAARQAEIAAETAQAEAERNRNVSQAEYKQTADTAKAEADMAYELKKAEISRQLALQEGNAEVERERQRGLAAEQQINVARQRTQAEVVVPANAQREAAIQQAEAEASARRIRATAEAEATKLTAGADAERTRATRTAEAAGIEATGLASAAAEKAQLLAKAEGEKELAEARAANDAVNLQLELARIDAGVRTEVGKAAADAMGRVGQNTRIVQIGGNERNGNGSGGAGSALFDMIGRIPEALAQLNAKVEALTGRNAGEWVDGVNQAVRGKEGALSRLTHENGKPEDDTLPALPAATSQPPTSSSADNAARNTGGRR